MSTTIFEKQGTNLTVYPKGRLDTVSSPVLEQELQQYFHRQLEWQLCLTRICRKK